MVTLLAPRPVDGAARRRLAELGLDADPAGLHAAVARGPRVIPGACWERCQALGVGLSQDGLGWAHGGWPTRDPRQVGLGELLAVGFPIAGALRHPRGQASGRVPLRPMDTHGLAHVWGLTAMATARVHQERKARVRLPHELPPDVVQVRPMIPAIPPGAGPDLGSGFFVAVGASIDLNARALQRANAGRKPQALSRGRGHQAVERSDPLGLEGRQRPATGIIVALCGSHTR